MAGIRDRLQFAAGHVQVGECRDEEGEEKGDDDEADRQGSDRTAIGALASLIFRVLRRHHRLTPGPWSQRHRSGWRAS